VQPNPANQINAVDPDQYSTTRRLITCLCLLLGGGLVAQLGSAIVVRIASTDIQAGGMLADIITQYLANYILGIAFIVLSVSNLLIKRGLVQYKQLRLPTIILAASTAVMAFMLIPRMDYLRETALLDGLPILFAPTATYFITLSALSNSLMLLQLASGGVLLWRQITIAKPID
jgi:hypothetical protein